MKALDFSGLSRRCWQSGDKLLSEAAPGLCPETENWLNYTIESAKQTIRQQIADLESELALVRQYASYAAWLQSHGRLDTRTASILKLRSADLAVTASQKCLQIHGSAGYLESSSISRLYRDSIGATIAAGPGELMRDMIYELE